MMEIGFLLSPRAACIIYSLARKSHLLKQKHSKLMTKARFDVSDHIRSSKAGVCFIDEYISSTSSTSSEAEHRLFFFSSQECQAG